MHICAGIHYVLPNLLGDSCMENRQYLFLYFLFGGISTHFIHTCFAFGACSISLVRLLAMTAQRTGEGDTDCWGCRLTGGLGGLGMGTYVLWQIRPSVVHTRSHRVIVGTFGAAFLFLGVTRLLEVWPFPAKRKSLQ